MKKIFKDILIFEIVMLIFTIFIIKPIISQVWKFALTVSGYHLVFNDSILSFFLTIPGILASLVILLIVTVIIYFEYCVIITYVFRGYQQKEYSISQSIELSFKGLRRLWGFGLPGLMVYLLLLVPYINGGISSTVLPVVKIPNFVTGELLKYPWGNLLLASVNVLLFLIFLMLLFVLPVMVLDGTTFFKAVKRSIKLLASYKFKILGIYEAFLMWKLLGIRLEKELTAPVFHVSLLNIRRISLVYGISKDMVMLSLVLIAFSVIKLILKPLMLIYLVRFFAKRGLNQGEPESIRTSTAKRLPLWLYRVPGLIIEKLQRKKVKRITGIVTVAVVVISTWLFFLLPPDLQEPVAIGHRGSLKGVENTVESIQGAIDAGAQYAEIDVFLSADGVPVVVHDANLKRLTGESLEVSDMTAKELKEIHLTQGKYEGNITTLDDILAYSKGKIDLAIELKSHGKEKKDLAKETIKVIEQFDYLDHVFFLSLNYELIADIKAFRPEAVAGYCVYQNVGAVQNEIITSMNIDFVIIEEAMANDDLVYDFRKAWIPVYVWTVNDPANMQRYLEMGIVGIITDYPDRAIYAIEMYRETSRVQYMPPEEWKE